MYRNFTHLIIINLFWRLSYKNLLDLFKVFICMIWINQNYFYLINNLCFVVSFFLFKTTRNCPGQSKHTWVFILTLKIGSWTVEVFKNKETSQNDILAVEQIFISSLIAELRFFKALDMKNDSGAKMLFRSIDSNNSINGLARIIGWLI